MKLTILTTLCLFFGHLVSAQLSFTNETSLLGTGIPNSAAPIGINDLNGDGYDDIVALDDTEDLIIYYQNADNTFTLHIHGQTTDAWALAIGDTDNDGYNDLYMSGAYNDKVFLTANGDDTYSTNYLDGPSYFAQATGFADIDNDGHIDLMSCHDDGVNKIWMNDGNGALFHDDTVIDFELFTPVSNNAGNYGICWTDFDQDGDIDLYIAKCRLGVSDPTDVRRINQLWVNDGNGNFTESAASYGLDIGAQSWTAEFQDIDNDGDFDFFVANHDQDSQLFENDNGTYVNITASSGISASGTSIVQALMKDFDNDGFVDLVLSDIYYTNNGDKTFTEITNPFGSNHSFAVGDLNKDGFLDVYTSHATGYNNPSNIDDILWMNDGNTNNFLSVTLEGTVSNRNAVGAKIEIIGGWGTMLREVRAGESYGITNSFTQNFGLGTYSTIDELIVYWPSGINDTLYNVAINQFLEITEVNNCNASAEIATNGNHTMCSASDQIELYAITEDVNSTFEWSTGETSNSIMVGVGIYTFTVTDGSGCEATSLPIEVLADAADCVNPCNTNLYLVGDLDGGDYSSDNQLKTSSTMLGAVHASAVDYVELKIGFETDVAFDFEANLDGCN